MSSLLGEIAIIFLHRYFDNEHLYFSQSLDVYEPVGKILKPYETRVYLYKK